MSDERFSLDLEAALGRAMEEARSRGHVLMEPEHVVLGVLLEDTVGGAALATLLDADRQGLALEFAEQLAEAKGEPCEVSPMRSGRLALVLEKAEEEAKRCGHAFVGTEHVVAVALEDDGSALAEFVSKHGECDRLQLLADFRSLLAPADHGATPLHRWARRLRIDDFPVDLHGHPALAPLLAYLDSMPEDEYQRSEFALLAAEQGTANTEELARRMAETIGRFLYESQSGGEQVGEHDL